MRFENLPSGLMVPRGPEILVPKHAEGQIDPKPVGIAGYIGWQLIRDGKVIRESPLQHNLLLDQGMNLIGGGVSLVNLVNQANMGTGAVAPVVGDVTMGAEVGTGRRTAALSVSDTYVVGPPDYWYRRYTYNFTETFANGNLTEIGIFHNGGTLAIRQLLKDGTGTPTTVTKTATDQLLITFEIRAYPPTADVTTTVNISGVDYTVLTRPANANNGGGWGNVLVAGLTATMGAIALETDVLGIRTSAPGGSFVQSTDHTQTGYVANSFYIENKEVWDTGFANFATGIGSIGTMFSQNALFIASIMFQSSFTVKIPKTNVKKLTIFVRRAFARYP